MEPFDWRESSAAIIFCGIKEQQKKRQFVSKFSSNFSVVNFCEWVRTARGRKHNQHVITRARQISHYSSMKQSPLNKHTQKALLCKGWFEKWVCWEPRDVQLTLRLITKTLPPAAPLPAPTTTTSAFKWTAVVNCGCSLWHHASHWIRYIPAGPARLRRSDLLIYCASLSIARAEASFPKGKIFFFRSWKQQKHNTDNLRKV